MKQSKKIYEKRTPQFGKTPDFTLLRTIIERGNTVDGAPVILGDSTYSRMQDPKKSKVMSLHLFMFGPTADDLEQLAREYPKIFSNKRLLRVTDEEIELLKNQMPMKIPEISKFG